MAESILKNFLNNIDRNALKTIKTMNSMVKLTVAYTICHRRLLSFDELLEANKGTFSNQCYLSDEEWNVLHMPNYISFESENRIRSRMWYQNIDKMFDRMKIEDVIRVIESLLIQMHHKLPQTGLNGSQNLWIVKPG